MAVIQFVRNFDDLSTDRGYQFKFYCDKCGNGYMTAFQASMIGSAGSLLRAAGNIFGGWASSAGNSTYELQRAIGGKAHDSALSAAVQEGKQHFHQCTRYGRWVCPEVCWNGEANLCEECAPNIKEEMASAHAQAKAKAARTQLFQRAAETNYTSNIDMSQDAAFRAPSSSQTTPAKSAKFCTACGADVGNGKFCPECGMAAKSAKPKCGKCGFEPAEGVKFCPECGNKI